MDLWKQWILAIGGKFSGPRTLSEFNFLDGRHINIKVDNRRVYVFNDPVQKVLFNIDDQWYELYDFDIDKLPWLNWMFKEPGVSLPNLIEQFKDLTVAVPYTQSPVTTTYHNPERFHYSIGSREFIIIPDIPL